MHRKSIIVLLASVSFLVIVGFVMLISTCIFSAHADSADGYKEAKRQGVWLLVGLGVCALAATRDYRFWKEHCWILLVSVCFLLVLCFVPSIGVEVNGERRWIGFSLFQIQPSELGKIAVVVFLAYWFSRHPDGGGHFMRGFAIPLAVVAIPVLLILFEVDIGSTTVISTTAFLVLFIAGTHWKYLSGLVMTGVAAFIGMMSYAPDRVERILAFLDLDAHRYGAGFQQWISLMALGSGGVTGRGVGEGRLKMLYMPFAHTDFIFPMIGEEMGLIVTMLVVTAYFSIVLAGFIIAFHAPDRFGMLLATGLVSLIGFQAFLNIGVAISILPNTGLTLPFVSYGGSSFVIGFLIVGILINIFRQGNVAEKDGVEWVLRKRVTPRV